MKSHVRSIGRSLRQTRECKSRRLLARWKNAEMRANWRSLSATLDVVDGAYRPGDEYARRYARRVNGQNNRSRNRYGTRCSP